MESLIGLGKMIAPSPVQIDSISSEGGAYVASRAVAGRVAGLVTAALELSCAAIVESFVGEAWMGAAPSATSIAASAPSIFSFVSPAALFVKGINSMGQPEKQRIDISLARAFAAEHYASQRLYTAALKAGAPFAVEAAELAGDTLLSKINFPVEVAVAVPIIGPADAPTIVLVIYCSRKAAVSNRYSKTAGLFCLDTKLRNLIILPVTHHPPPTPSLIPRYLMLKSLLYQKYPPPAEPFCTPHVLSLAPPPPPTIQLSSGPLHFLHPAPPRHCHPPSTLTTS